MADIVAEDVAARGWHGVPVSAASHEGLRELIVRDGRLVAARRAAEPAVESRRASCCGPQAQRRRRGVHGPRPAIDRRKGWRVRGEKPERWIRQTDFSNDEAVGFLADRLNRLGVEAKLLELGAVEGDPVLIGDPANAVVFDFKPGIDAGAEMLGRRGEDQRFTESRPAADRRRAIDEAMPDRGEGETRADVARTAGHADLADEEPGRPQPRRERTSDEPRGGRADAAARRGQGRVVVADHRRRRHRPRAGARPGRQRSPTVRARGAEVVLVSSGAIAAGLSPLALRKRPTATSPASRRPRRSARGCWCTATPRSSPATARSPARCCSRSTT